MRFCLRVWAGVVPATLWMVMFSTTGAHAEAPRSADGNRVLAQPGYAPLQVELFCEPQCPHCAELESTDGERVNPTNPGTPTVYDVKANRVVDLHDPAWLDAFAS